MRASAQRSTAAAPACRACLACCAGTARSRARTTARRPRARATTPARPATPPSWQRRDERPAASRGPHSAATCEARRSTERTALHLTPRRLQPSLILPHAESCTADRKRLRIPPWSAERATYAAVRDTLRRLSLRRESERAMVRARRWLRAAVWAHSWPPPQMEPEWQTSHPSAVRRPS